MRLVAERTYQEEDRHAAVFWERKRSSPCRLGLALLVVLAALVSMASPGGASAAPTGLVAAYGFDEGSGTTVADASGNGHTGTITGATWAATGKYGKALQFNGTSALVTVPDAASLHLSSGMTLEACGQPLGGQRQLA